MGRRCMGMAMAALLTAALAGSAEPIDVGGLTEAVRQAGALRLEALRTVQRLLRESPKREEALDALGPVLDAVAELPRKGAEREALNLGYQIFVQNRITSPAAVAFARNLVAREPTEENARHWDAAIRLMRLNGIPDEAFKKSLVGSLSELPFHLLPEAFRYFGDHYCDAAAVIGAATELLAGADRATTTHALRHFGLLKLDRKSAAKIVQKGFDALEAKDRRLAWDYLNVFTARPGVYSGLLSQAQTGKLAGLVKTADAEQAQIALMMLAATGDPGKDAVPLVLERFGSVTGRDLPLLMILGLMPTARMTDVERQRLLDALKSQEARKCHDALAGLASAYIRSANDPQKAAAELAQLLPKYVALHQWSYWKAFSGRAFKTIIPPKQWKTNWNIFKNRKPPSAKVIDAVRAPILQSLPCHPDCPEATWVIDQAVEENVRPDLLLPALEALAVTNAKLATTDKLRAWLAAAAGKEASFDIRCRAARLLADIFQEAEAAVSLVEAAYRASPERLAWWSAGTEVLLRYGKDTDALKRVRAALAADSSLPGGEFLVWLLAVRLGDEDGPPPTESLPGALARPDATAWTAGLKAARERLTRDHLAALRHPSLLLTAKDLNTLQAYLGTLDALVLWLSSRE